MKKTFKILKSVAKKDENLALDLASEKLRVHKSRLVPEHTENCFVFTISEATVFVVAKSTEPDKSLARKLAKAHFNTFEGNLRCTETENAFEFSKIR